MAATAATHVGAAAYVPGMYASQIKPFGTFKRGARESSETSPNSSKIGDSPMARAVAKHAANQDFKSLKPLSGNSAKSDQAATHPGSTVAQAISSKTTPN